MKCVKLAGVGSGGDVSDIAYLYYCKGTSMRFDCRMTSTHGLGFRARLIVAVASILLISAPTAIGSEDPESGTPGAASDLLVGGGTDPHWVHRQSWGDWCRFVEADAAGHGKVQVYEAVSTWRWWIEDDVIHQVVEQEGTMTTGGMTRPFSSRQVTSGPAEAYLDPPAELKTDHLFEPRYWDDDLTIRYRWDVEDYYAFRFVNQPDEPRKYGATTCG